MAIKADHSDLPRGNPPSPNPQFGPLLAEAWRDAKVDTTPLAFAVDGARLRASWAGRCSREIGYQVAGVAESNPPGLSTYWRFGLGHMVHAELQTVLAAAFPGASIEHVTDWEALGLPGASHVDVFLVHSVLDPDNVMEGADAEFITGQRKVYKRTVIEIKTTNGYAFKLMVGARGAAQGPKNGALLQAALSARALGADEVVIIYLSMECLSQREADKIGTGEVGKFAAEWPYPMSALDEMVDREIVRLGKILELVDAGELAPRHTPGEMPPTSRVIDPMTGAWTLERDGNVLEAGTLWSCKDYCSFRDQCAKDGPS